MPPTSTTAMMTAKITPTIQPGTSKETRIASTTELACTAGANTMAQPRITAQKMPSHFQLLPSPRRTYQ
ncbi:Uncharacterised protein [uncultured Blautia sp.]|nr:Uncharacterised protein [uncultured Blautia sp.]